MRFKKTKRLSFCLLAFILLTIALIYVILPPKKINVQGKVVLCIPVYGQSLALGEEANLITDFDTFITNSHRRIVTENLDYKFGYFDGNSFKQMAKRLLHYRKRTFELSIYGMSERIIQQLGTDTIICTFPGGQGATILANLSKETPPYKRFISDIKKAYDLSQKGKCTRFYVPAICWMQGETDISDDPDTDYQKLLLQFKKDINNDIKSITHQTEEVRIICYQANNISRNPRFQANNYNCHQTKVPQAFVNLLLSDSSFWASSPTYPYPFVREAIHIDGISQKRLGNYEGLTSLAILRHQPRFMGLIPLSSEYSDSTVTVHFNVPCPPLVFDTVQVQKAENYGFSVITPDNRDIALQVDLDSCCVHIRCSSSPSNCKVRYAVNGTPGKSGCQNGPRGNLHDSQGEKHKVYINGKVYALSNWAYQFDITIGKSLK